MSYCVQCGVELAPSEPRCPLCGTPVLNPNDPWKAPKQNPYPKELDASSLPRQIDQRYALAISSLLLLIPALITFVLNLMLNRTISWSLYVIGAELCIFVLLFLPLFFRKKWSPYFFFCLDECAIAIYLFLINFLTGGNWFLAIGLPLSALVFLFSLSICFFIRNRVIRGFYKVAIFFLLLGLSAVGIECILHYGPPVWALFVLLPCLVFALIFWLLEKNQNLKARILRKLFL